MKNKKIKMNLFLHKIQVLSKKPHPTETTWNVCSVDFGKGEPVTVVCGGTAYEAGDLVAYVPVGQNYKGKVKTKHLSILILFLCFFCYFFLYVWCVCVSEKNTYNPKKIKIKIKK